MITKQASWLTQGWDQLFQAGRGTLKRVHQVAKPAYRVGKSMATAGLKGAGAAGRAVGRNPRVGIPMAGLAAYTAYRLPETLKKQLAHQDPNQHYTYSEPVTGKLRYRDTSRGFRDHVQFQNRFV